MGGALKFRQLRIEQHGGLIRPHWVPSKHGTGDGAGDFAAEGLDHRLDTSLSKVCAEGERGSSGDHLRMLARRVRVVCVCVCVCARTEARAASNLWEDASDHDRLTRECVGGRVLAGEGNHEALLLTRQAGDESRGRRCRCLGEGFRGGGTRRGGGTSRSSRGGSGLCRGRHALALDKSGPCALAHAVVSEGRRVLL